MSDVIDGAFDRFFNVDTWHTQHQLDVARFYSAIRALHLDGQGTPDPPVLLERLVSELRKRKEEQAENEEFLRILEEYSIWGAAVCEYMKLDADGLIKLPG